MTKLDKLLEIRALVDELILVQTNRINNERQRYEQRKANNGCTAAISCKNKVVPGYTMCSYHLRKQAEASSRRDRKKKWSKDNG